MIRIYIFECWPQQRTYTRRVFGCFSKRKIARGFGKKSVTYRYRVTLKWPTTFPTLILVDFNNEYFNLCHFHRCGKFSLVLRKNAYLLILMIIFFNICCLNTLIASNFTLTNTSSHCGSLRESEKSLPRCLDHWREKLLVSNHYLDCYVVNICVFIVYHITRHILFRCNYVEEILSIGCTFKLQISTLNFKVHD